MLVRRLVVWPWRPAVLRRRPWLVTLDVRSRIVLRSGSVGVTDHAPATWCLDALPAGRPDSYTMHDTRGSTMSEPCTGMLSAAEVLAWLSPDLVEDLVLARGVHWP